MAIRFNEKFAAPFLDADDLACLTAQVEAAHKMIADGSGLGNDFLGWVDLPENYDKDLETGLMPTEKCVVSTNSINEEILIAIANKRPTESDIREYALFVYDSIKRVVEWDVFYTNNDYKARNNPYALTVKVIPLYFAVRHVMDWCYAESVRDAAKKAFRDIIERDISPLEECVDEILFNIIDRPYTQSIYEIYKIVTVKGECGLFLLRNVL